MDIKGSDGEDGEKEGQIDTEDNVEIKRKENVCLKRGKGDLEGTRTHAHIHTLIHTHTCTYTHMDARTHTHLAMFVKKHKETLIACRPIVTEI